MLRPEGVPGQSGDTDLPEGLPPEFAEAYRQGYARAYTERAGSAPPGPAAPATSAYDDPGGRRVAEPDPGLVFEDYDDDRERHGWAVPALLVALALLLVLGAYVLGRVFS